MPIGTSKLSIRTFHSRRFRRWISCQGDCEHRKEYHGASQGSGSSHRRWLRHHKKFSRTDHAVFRGMIPAPPSRAHQMRTVGAPRVHEIAANYVFHYGAAASAVTLLASDTAQVTLECARPKSVKKRRALQRQPALEKTTKRCTPSSRGPRSLRTVAANCAPRD